MLAPSQPRRNIVLYLTRNARNVRNKGRRVANEPEVHAALAEWTKSAGLELVTFVHYHFKTVRELNNYLRTRVIAFVGPHGGSFTQLAFSPLDMCAVEIEPALGSKAEAHYRKAYHHAFSHKLALLSEQPYVWVGAQRKILSLSHDMIVSPYRVIDALVMCLRLVKQKKQDLKRI